MKIVCLDLEGTLMPEIWPNIAKMTMIDELKLTTRDIPDFNLLMKKRLKILKEKKIKIKDIEKIIKRLKLFKGAPSFLKWLKKRFQVIILSDSFYEFINPIINKFFNITIFCNSLEIDKNGFIKGYKIKKKNWKQDFVKYLKLLGFQIIAIGDSYNDLKMIKEADFGVLFNPPKNIIGKNQKFQVAKNYRELKSLLIKFLKNEKDYRKN